MPWIVTVSVLHGVPDVLFLRSCSLHMNTQDHGRSQLHMCRRHGNNCNNRDCIYIYIQTDTNEMSARHGKFEVTACKTQERFYAGFQHCSCINKNVHNLVRIQFLVQHDNQSTPRNVLGDYWVNRESAIRVLCMRAPSSRSSNRVRA